MPSDCAAVQSDPRLCCKHPGEFVIFSCFFSLLLFETCTLRINNKKQTCFFSFIVLKETINNLT